MKTGSASLLRAGDVVRIPIDENRVGFGQVLDDSDPSVVYLAIFGSAYPTGQEPEPHVVASDVIRFLGLTFDALVANGEWTVVGNLQPADDIPRPVFKEAVGASGVWHVVSFDGARRRPATAEEATLLPFRRAWAPILMQKALQAAHAVGPWLDTYKALEYERVAQLAALEI
jgi:hypothetical protein